MICEVCEQEAGEDLTLCGHCLSRLIAVVRDIPDMLRTLVATVHKRAQMGGSGAGDSYSRPLPLNMDALTAQTDLQKAYRDLFTSLHKMFPDPVGGRIDDVAAFLDDYMTCVQVLPTAASWFHRIVDTYRKAATMADRPVERVTLGVCGKILEAPEGQTAPTCPEPLTAPVGKPTVRCRVCGTVWLVRSRQEDAYEAARDAVEYAPVIIRALASQGIKASLVDINDWQNRATDPLVPAETDDNGRKLYRFSDVYKLAVKVRRRKEKA